jgi:hypothetical protein
MNKNSLAAYRSIGAHLDSHYLDIFEILLARGCQTAWEIAGSSYGLMTEAQVYRRLSEMVKAGWIEKLDWDTVTPTGCYASTYWICTKETK